MICFFSSRTAMKLYKKQHLLFYNGCSMFYRLRYCQLVIPKYQHDCSPYCATKLRLIILGDHFLYSHDLMFDEEVIM